MNPMPKLPEEGEYGNAPYDGIAVIVTDSDGYQVAAEYHPRYGDMIERVFVTLDDTLLIPAENSLGWKPIDLTQEPGAY